MAYQLAYPSYARALYEALKDDPYYAALAALVEVGPAAEAMVAYFDYAMTEAARYGELYLPGDPEVGVSLWSKPVSAAAAAEKRRSKDAFLLANLGQRCLEAYGRIMEWMNQCAAPLVTEDAWYLSIVGVLPEYQNQGMGARLVGSVLAESDAAGVATYLETFTPRNMPFYGRLGFEVAGSFVESVTGSTYVLMVRAPAKPT